MRAEGLNQALEGIKGLAGLGGGAVVLYVVYMIGDLILPKARAGAPGGHGDILMNDWFGIGLDQGLPLAFLGLFFFTLLAQGILRSQRR